METLWQDTRHAIRVLANNLGFSIVAVLTLALGIGANTALFSVINGVLLNPLPFPNAQQLVTFYESKPNFERGSLSYPNFLDWRNDNHTFQSMALYRSENYTLTGMGTAESLDGEMVSANLFSLLGVKPVLGRSFKPEEDHVGAAPVVLISAALWNRKFGGSVGVIGRVIALGGVDHTIIGVIPPGFHLPIQNFQKSDVYVPIGQSTNPRLKDRSAAWGMDGIGRLKSGISIRQARADMDAITKSLAAAYPDADKGISATLVPLKDAMIGAIQPYLLVLLAAVLFVLLIACANVGNLLLARSQARRREFAIRSALGATQLRVIRQLITESVLLAILGGSLGLLLALWGTQAALHQLPSALPRAENIGIDAHVLVFTAIVSLVTGILFGLAPALSAARPDVNEALKQGGRGTSGARHASRTVFVTLEMAMALVLLIGAGLMIRSLARLWSVNPGFNSHNVLVFGLTLSPSMTSASPNAIRAAYRGVLEKIESTPGVQSASLSWGATPMYGDDEELFWLEGQPKPAHTNDMNWSLDYIVSPDYLKVMQTRLERGRFFTNYDDSHSQFVVVVDDVFAHKYFPNRDPIGQRLRFDNFDEPATIIGVAAHVKQWGLDSDDTNTLRSQLYIPFMQMADKAASRMAQGTGVVVRTARSPLELTSTIRHAIAQLSSQHVMFGATTMDDIVATSLAQRRFSMILLALFAGLALLLASIGLYGVVSYVVGQRTQEIGIRVALGANRSNILLGVLANGLRMTLYGAGIGILAAFGAMRFIAGVLAGVSTDDPLTFVSVPFLLILIALLACYVPARRAMNVDPILALRHE